MADRAIQNKKVSKMGRFLKERLLSYNDKETRVDVIKNINFKTKLLH